MHLPCLARIKLIDSRIPSRNILLELANFIKRLFIIHTCHYKVVMAPFSVAKRAASYEGNLSSMLLK